MDKKALRSDALLLTTAVIWGLAFVAQRVGMEYVGPFTFNGVRFLLGAMVLLPFLLKDNWNTGEKQKKTGSLRTMMFSGGLAGVVLFSGASLQQAGLVYTSAGNAGFITGLYVVIVPIMGLVFGHRTHTGTWIGVVLAAVGMYLLSVTEQFTMAFGDMLVLASAFFWALHVIVIGWISPWRNPIRLAFCQYMVCSALSLVIALCVETITMHSIIQAMVPIFYGGVFSVGMAYTLQVVAQRHAPPAHSAIILSLESVFAAVGGWLFLREMLSVRELTGCVLMLCGMLFSRLWKTTRSPGQ
ncbi:MAG: DMT family transporter [Thermodesulfobacteriota bacterium]|nr:DMT family transporter [Thermodesulfobacteriota bacterium]